MQTKQQQINSNTQILTNTKQPNKPTLTHQITNQNIRKQTTHNNKTTKQRNNTTKYNTHLAITKQKKLKVNNTINKSNIRQIK